MDIPSLYFLTFFNSAFRQSRPSVRAFTLLTFLGMKPFYMSWEHFFLFVWKQRGRGLGGGPWGQGRLGDAGVNLSHFSHASYNWNWSAQRINRKHSRLFRCFLRSTFKLGVRCTWVFEFSKVLKENLPSMKYPGQPRLSLSLHFFPGFS